MSDVVEHGPFPIRPWRLLGGCATLALSVLLSAMLLDATSLACGPDRCRLERPFASARSLGRASIRRVRVDRVTGSRGATYGEPVIELDGGELRLIQVDPERAEEFAREVNTALATGRSFDARLRPSYWLGAGALLLFAFGIALVASSLVGLGRYRLVLASDRRTLSVERRVLGIRVARSHVSLEGAVDVEVEWTWNEDPLLHRRGAPLEAHARLVLVAASGERRPLSARFHRGYTVHRTAEGVLRERLGLGPRDRARQEHLDRVAEGHHPPAPWYANAAGRFGAAWIGATCGTLGGMTVYALLGLALGLLHANDSVDKWALLVGGGGGAASGVALALYWTRARSPR